jgi:hypothetical protein
LFVFHADGPVAIESAIVRRYSSDTVSTSPINRATRTIVASSVRSRRVAVSAMRRWCWTSSPTVAASAWNSAASRSRCGRGSDAATSPSNPGSSNSSAARATASSRCRSTV